MNENIKMKKTCFIKEIPFYKNNVYPSNIIPEYPLRLWRKLELIEITEEQISKYATKKAEKELKELKEEEENKKQQRENSEKCEYCGITARVKRHGYEFCAGCGRMYKEIKKQVRYATKVIY